MKTVEAKRSQLAENLIALAPQITEKEKALAVVELDASLSTINKYLKGEIPNVWLAEAMCQWFKAAIAKRA